MRRNRNEYNLNASAEVFLCSPAILGSTIHDLGIKTEDYTLVHFLHILFNSHDLSISGIGVQLPDRASSFVERE